MLITSLLAAEALASRLFLDDPDDGEAFREHLSRHLARVIMREGESNGAFIREQSAWVDWDRPVERTDLGPLAVAVRAYWSPDPTEGVELRGGHLDGDVVHLRREVDGRPMPYLVLPDHTATVEALGATVPMIPTSELRTRRYRRAGIDSERDRWVYLADD